MFREEARPVGDNVEHPSRTFDEFSFHARFGFDLGRQTGGLREIVSDSTVGNRYVHGLLGVSVHPLAEALTGLFPLNRMLFSQGQP